jgi:hypothetical protein
MSNNNTVPTPVFSFNDLKPVQNTSHVNNQTPGVMGGLALVALIFICCLGAAYSDEQLARMENEPDFKPTSPYEYEQNKYQRCMRDSEKFIPAHEAEIACLRAFSKIH